MFKQLLSCTGLARFQPEANTIKKKIAKFILITYANVLRRLVGFRYGKKNSLSKSFVTVLLKMTLCLYIYFVFAKKLF